jgi:hypothetical protein
VQVPSTILSSEPGEIIPQDRQSKYNVISGRDRAPTDAAEKKSITYSDCVSVAFLCSMQRACTELYCHLWPYHIFPHYLIKGTFSEKSY